MTSQRIPVDGWMVFGTWGGLQVFLFGSLRGCLVCFPFFSVSDGPKELLHRYGGGLGVPEEQGL